MLTGEVTADKEAIVRLSVHDDAGDVYAISAVIDTGFTEHLTLPPVMVATLMLPLSYSTEMTLADGTRRMFPVHMLRLDWQSQVLTIPILAIEGTPLIGMSLLYGSAIHLVVLDGGRVTIEPV